MALASLISVAGSHSSSLLSSLLLLALLSSGTVWLYYRYFYVDLPQVQGVPEIPGGSLLYGHLHLLGKDHPTTAEYWSRKYQWPVFQIRLGYRRVVVLNSFEATREWLVTHQSATIDRPLFYTFHEIISKTSAATIGTNPWNERTRKQRLVVGSLTTAPAIKRLASLIDLETAQMIVSISQASVSKDVGNSPVLHQQRLALNVMVMFCYGRRFDSVENPLLLQILQDATIIATFRSTNANTQDYVKPLRYIPDYFKDRKRMSLALEVRSRRDKWLADLLEEVKVDLAAGKPNNCVAAGLITDTESRLTKDDVRTILGGLMSGGFETVYSTALAGIGYLSSSEGQEVQQKAFEDILPHHGGPMEAFQACVHGEKSAYVVAFVREILRHYPPLRFLPPRQTIKAFVTKDGVLVPKGLMIQVNCQAANHDPATYGPDADAFRPERWLDDQGPQIPAPYDFTFGAGSRMCTAVNFSTRILYAIFVRIIVCYKIRQNDLNLPHPDCADCTLDSKSYCVNHLRTSFEIRDKAVFDACIQVSEKNTENVSNGIVR